MAKIWMMNFHYFSDALLIFHCDKTGGNLNAPDI